MRALALRIVRGQADQHADAPHALGLLRARRERPCRRRAAEQRMNSRRLIARSPFCRGIVAIQIRILEVLYVMSA